MYDELVKDLREISRNRAIPVHMAETVKEAANAIENMSEAYEKLSRHMDDLAALMPRWISVSERLPETPGEYMVAYHPCYWDSVHDEIKIGLDSFRGKTSWAKKKYQRVTHWMPLPQPPKEE